MTEERIRRDAMKIMATYPVAPLATPAKNVQRCIAEMTRAGQIADKEGMEAQERRKMARIAYKLHMPTMEDRPSIFAYIACVAHGISLGIFNGRDASQMLYAAQVALSLLKDPKAAGRPRVAKRRAA